MDNNFKSAKRVLIYRLGSIGDTVVALPCFKLMARVFPNAERRVLTNFADGAKVVPIDAILGPMNLIHGYFRYPLNTRNPGILWRVSHQIRAWGPEVLVYLAEPRGRLKALRDVLFFKACGISKVIGVPWGKDLQNIRRPSRNGLWEAEAVRLARCLESLDGEIFADPASWGLELTVQERARAAEVLDGLRDSGAFMGASIGTKMDTNDWGKENWKDLLGKWGGERPDFGLAIIGSQDEYVLAEEVATEWPGPVSNLCGKLTPRESAAVLEKVALFVGHDSGPMHLAAAVGTPCVAIFSARNRPGVWFPFGTNHRVIYHQTPCYGCGLRVCNRFDKMCIRSITVDEVFLVMKELYETRRLNHSCLKSFKPSGYPTPMNFVAV